MVTIAKTSFNGGEWSPEMQGRNVDLPKSQTAVKKMRNFLASPFGGAFNRGGTEFTCEVKASDKITRLIPFQFSVVQSYMLEFGEQYIRVIKDGGRIINSPRVYHSLINSNYKWSPSPNGPMFPSSIRNATYKWTQSSTVTNTSLNDNAGWTKVAEGAYYVYKLVSPKPNNIYEGGVWICEYSAATTLYTTGMWRYESGTTIVVRLNDDQAPNSHSDGYVRGTFQYSYYCELAAGGDPSLAEPYEIQNSVGTAFLTKSSDISNLLAGTWGYGDADSLGYNTIYVRLSGGGDPDSEATDYLNGGYAEEFYLESSLGGDSGLYELTYLVDTTTNMEKGTVGVLPQNSWGYGDNDNLGYNTTYVRLSGGTDPNSKDDDIIYGYRHTAVPLVNGDYQWTASSYGTRYYVEKLGGGNPEIIKPYTMYMQGVELTETDVNSVVSGNWGYGDLEGLGLDTIYIGTGVDPDTQRYGYIEASYMVEIETPYLKEDLALIKYDQSADTLILYHPSYPTKTLTRTAHDKWVFEDIEFGSEIVPPINVACSGSGERYIVTSTDFSNRESVGSDAVVGAAGNAITWDTQDGAEYYNIYKEMNDSNLFGWIGQANDTTFTEPSGSIEPDTEITPPIYRNPFSGANNYPACGAFYQQRLVHARTNNKPQSVMPSVTGDFYNMNISSPIQDNDSFTATMDSSQVNEIKWMISLTALLIGTTGGIWKMSARDSASAMTFKTVSINKEGQHGVSDLKPILIGSTVLYVGAACESIRDLAYSFEADGYNGQDLTLFAKHLFKDYDIVSWTYEEHPNSTVWCIRDDGALLGLTYYKEHEVIGWHRHDTDGLFKDIETIKNGAGKNETYVIVEREINGNTVQYIERFMPRLPMTTAHEYDVKDAWFLDCALKYDGTPITEVTAGLEHLEGETIYALVDGSVFKNLLVASGGTSWGVAGSKVLLGIPYTQELETMELEYQTEEGTVQNKVRDISSVTLRLLNTRGLKIGPNDYETDESNLSEPEFRTDEDYGEPTRLFTGDKTVNISPSSDGESRIYIKNSDPIPINILAMYVSADSGEI